VEYALSMSVSLRNISEVRRRSCPIPLAREQPGVQTAVVNDGFPSAPRFGTDGEDPGKVRGVSPTEVQSRTSKAVRYRSAMLQTSRSSLLSDTHRCGGVRNQLSLPAISRHLAWILWRQDLAMCKSGPSANGPQSFFYLHLPP